MFERNEGNIDRGLRIAVGVALLAAFFMMPDASYRLWLLIGVVPLMTGLVGSCPVYTILGISTCPIKNDD